MNNLLKTTILFLLLIKGTSYAQEYAPPLDIKMLLSGTFGELRGNHFHTGIDIKTNGIEGQKVYAISEGYVSRIKVSSWGYGKAIYINHPDGRTSVYAHLKKFNSRIDSLIKIEHYKKESYELNFYPNKDEIKIKKGEFIALSGNSGSSGGAHLHFEIRDTRSEHPINPLPLGFDISDNIAPILRKVKLYTLNNSTIDGVIENKIFNLTKEKNNYTISETPVINGSFAIGICTYDNQDGSYNKNGVYSIKISVDSTVTYIFSVDKLDFNTNRYINAHIDYQEKKENKNKYHKCYKLPNNRLNNYITLINDGVISWNDDKLHLLEVEVSDISGNISTLTMNIQSTKNKIRNSTIKTTKGIVKKFSYKKPNIFKTKNIELHMQANSLYEDLDFNYQNKDSIKGVFGMLHQVHNDYTPVHKKYILSIKENIPEKLKNKVFIAKKDNYNNFTYMGGTWKNGFLKAKIREFGDFCIIADTIKPEIKGVNIYPGKIIKSQTTIKCTIKDKESGIQSFRAELNERWILMEYDHKKNLLRFDIDNNMEKGEYIFTLEVRDNVGNITNYRAEFTL